MAETVQYCSLVSVKETKKSYSFGLVNSRKSKTENNFSMLASICVSLNNLCVSLEKLDHTLEMKNRELKIMERKLEVRK